MGCRIYNDEIPDSLKELMTEKEEILTCQEVSPDTYIVVTKETTYTGWAGVRMYQYCYNNAAARLIKIYTEPGF